VDPRPSLLDADDDLTHVDAIPAPLFHIPPPARPAPKGRAPIPPPLPIPLTRKVADAGTDGALPLVSRRQDPDEAWLANLPPESRNVLEAARRHAAGWPTAPRLEHAVAQPVEARRRS
jgi:hypothetical protein